MQRIASHVAKYNLFGMYLDVKFQDVVVIYRRKFADQIVGQNPLGWLHA
ncbi:MAG TPA: hypothetical protein VGR72_04820 [Candidatus Acidoferrales bacterium]|nr:hypothetical protein [Candidatus Acidoferrales bacterium]